MKQLGIISTLLILLSACNPQETVETQESSTTNTVFIIPASPTDSRLSTLTAIPSP